MTEIHFSQCPYCREGGGQLILTLDDELRRRLLPDRCLTIRLAEEPIQGHVTVGGQHPDAAACPHLLLLVGNAQISRPRSEVAFVWEAPRLRSCDASDPLSSFLWDVFDGDMPDHLVPSAGLLWDEFNVAQTHDEELAAGGVQIWIEGYSFFASDRAEFLRQAPEMAKAFFAELA